jgi:hypothetical protein
MTIPAATKNAMLDGQAYTHISFHTAYPGTTGTSEVSGGSYVRPAITVNAGSGGSRLLNASVNSPVPACTIPWLGLWNSATFVCAIPNGGATPKNFMAVPSSDLIYATGHGWADTQKITFFGTPPSPIVEGDTVFVRDAATDTFKVALTAGGSALNLTTSSSAGCWVIAITEDVYGAPGTHTVSAGTITIPD